MPIFASVMDFSKSDLFFDHSLQFLNLYLLISFVHSSTIRFLGFQLVDFPGDYYSMPGLLLFYCSFY